jgi:hypothetical protein
MWEIGRAAYPAKINGQGLSKMRRSGSAKQELTAFATTTKIHFA